MIEHTVLPVFEVVSLAREDYVAVLQDLSRRGIAGGTIFDALHVYTAQKVQAEEILTLNQRHFQRLYPDLADRVVLP